VPEEKLPQPDIDQLDQPDEQPPHESFVWTKRKAIATIAGSAALFSASFIGITKIGDAYVAAHPPVSYGGPATPGDRELPPYGADACPAISQTYVAKAEQMLIAPENPAATKAVEKGLLQSMAGRYTVMPESSYDTERKITNRSEMWSRPHIRYPVAKGVADRLGLTLFDNRKYITEVGDGSNVDTELSRQEVLAKTQKFLRQYDITVRFATEKDGHPVKRTVNGETISDSYNAREALYAIANTIATFPKEYVALSGIKQIVLAGDIVKLGKSEVYTAAAAAMANEKVWFDIDAASPHAVAHEIGHGVMQAVCGGSAAAHEDKQLAAGSKGADAYDEDFKGVSYETYAVELQQIEKGMLEQRPYSSRLEAVQQEAVRDVSTTTGYGHTAVQEDGAELTAALTTDEFYTMRHAMIFPKLRRKLSVTFSRLAYYRPAIAEYFMQTSLKAEKSLSPTDAIMPDMPASKK
jgi:hypothetical protein